MELKKKDLLEIIDGNGELIGNNSIPSVDANAETQASNTSDYNAKVGAQPFRYDMLGRFGFTLMPFMEGEDKNQGQAELENDLVDLMNQRYIDILSHYFRNPKRIKSDYRKHVTDDEISEETMKFSVEWADKILKVIEDHFGKAFEKIEKIENIILDDRLKNWFIKKTERPSIIEVDTFLNTYQIERTMTIQNFLEKWDELHELD